MDTRDDRRALLQSALEAVETMQAKLAASEHARTEPIAIVGLGCRLPGAEDPTALWRLLHDGVDAVREVPRDRWDPETLDTAALDERGRAAARLGGFLERVDLFDPAFFAISPREALTLDPQQRLLLEVTWEALEDAALAPDRLHGSSTGVFVGITTSDYAKLVGVGEGDQTDVYAATGNALNAAAGRLAFVLGLHGPCMAVDTACSSSLTAIHLACQSLRAGECDLALAGGVNVVLSPDAALLFARWGMLAADGRCKTFDAAADGFVRSEGCGVIVLKRLSAALAAGDRVRAVILGSAVNQDGASSGLTVPNGPAQEAVIRRALAVARLQAHEVDYVEAHGTGTPLGDPIEVEALAAVMAPGRPADRPLAIGSIKTNIGHPEAASGVAGLLKVVLALEHEAIPPHLHFRERSPRIPWPGDAIYVPARLTPWPRGERRRIAGVSSFGFSGTNAHLIVAEPPVPAALASVATADRPWHLVTVSGRTEAALKAGAERLAAHLASDPDLGLPDLGYTRNVGRSHLAHRAAVIAKNIAEAREGLLAVATGAEAAGVRRGSVQAGQRPRVAWLFTGQGSQYIGMGRELYRTQPVFRCALERCDAALRTRLERPLLEVVFGGPESAALLDETAYTQPALFALEWALAELWRAWGVVPAAVMGHSVGEIAAAAVAGVLTPEDGAILAAERGRLMQACRRGAMTAVLAGDERVQALLTGFRGALSLAAVNGPESTVVSGEPDAMVAFRAACDADGIRSKPLTVSHAFHSPMMDPMLDALEKCARNLTHAEPQVELISNLTGDAAKPGDVGPAYWRRHAREAVRFEASMRALRDRGCDVFLEIGPQPTLLGMGRRCVEGGVWLPSLRPGQPEWSTLLESLGELYTHGAPIDWAAFDAEWPRRKLPLPSYPFQRSRYWVDADARSRSARQAGGRPAGGHPFLPLRIEVADGSGAQVFQGEIGIPLFPYLRDHRVQQGAVVPATAWTEMVLGAFTAAYGPGPVIVEGIEYQKPLFLTDDARHGIQVILKPSAAGVGFTIGSRRVDDAAGGPGWTQHVTGRMRRGEPADGRRRPDVAELGVRCPDEVAGTAFYPLLRERGNDWGPMFQGVERLWRSAGEAWSMVRVPPALESEVGSYQCHPAVADAAGHVLTATVAMQRSSGPRGGAFVGGGIEEIRVYRPLRGGRVWSHARLRESADLASNVLVGDVEVFDEAGELISEVRGARLWYLDADAPPARRRDVGDWFFGIDWVALPQPQGSGSATSGPAVDAGRWIVVADAGAVLPESLGNALTARGGAADFVSAQPDGLQARLQEILGAGARPPRGVVYLAIHSDDSVVSGVKNAGEASGCAQALQVVRALRAAQMEERPRVWLVTRGAQAVDGSNVTDALAGALWGLGRSLAVEHLEMWGGLVDLDPGANAGESAARIVDELLGPHGDDQVAFRGKTRFVPRLARLRPRSAGPLPLRADASYLVTGGFGGLGIAVARALVQRGARHVVLMARTELPARASWRDLPDGPRARAAAAVREIESLGASVLPAAVDIADPDSLGAWLDGFRAEGRPPIRGVVHLAGVLAHRALHEETAEGLEAALRPKVLGALSLHRLLQREDLDFFVLFSSAAAVLSSPLLGAYAAANAFLDALAHYRRGHGLPALSVNWGLWGETGMATRFQAEDVSALAQRGMGTIGTAEGVEALWRLIGTDVAHAAVLPVDWAEWARRYPAFAEAPFLSKVVAGAGLRDECGAIADKNRGKTREAILAAPAEDRGYLVQAFVTEQVAQVMRVAAEELDVQQPLRALGLDSLMAVEIRNRVEAGLGVALPLVTLLEGPSIATMAREVDVRVGEPRAQSATGPDVRDAAHAAHLLERMGDLSDAEVQALLERMLPGERCEMTSDEKSLVHLTAQEKRDLLAQLLREKALGGIGTFPLSFGQQALWLLHQVAPESAAYNVVLAARIRPPLNLSALQSALRGVFQRHGMLRSAFRSGPEGPVQEIRASVDSPPEFANAKDWTEEELQSRLLQESRRPLSLEAGPVRVVLFARPAGAVVLLFVVHHVAFDAWSLGLVIKELQTAYDASLSGTLVALPPPRAEYRDFVEWQARLLSVPEGEVLWNFWRGQLSGELPILELPTDRPRPAVVSFRGASLEFTLATRVVGALRKVAQGQGQTLFTMLLAAFITLLHRYSGQTDLLVGAPTAGRSRAEFEGVVGYFVNPVVVRATVENDPTFFEFLERLGSCVRDALRHADFPFPLLVQRLQPNRDPSRSPIFQTMFNYFRLGQLGLQEGASASRGEAGLALETISLPQQEGQFDLSLDIGDADTSLICTLKYSTDLFDESTIVRMAGHFQTLLGGIAAEPNQRLAALPLLTDAERTQVRTWNATDAPHPQACVHDLITAQATRTPGRVAVECAGVALTYREVDDRAEYLAGHLRSLGVGPDVLVAVCLDRTAEMVVAVLGVLKAGGAYVPLDPAYPAERLAYMIKDSGASVLLSQRAVAETMRTSSVRVVLADEPSETWGNAKGPAASPENLAYVIYTSGSTGKPKGVPIAHRALMNLLMSMAREPGLTAEDVLLSVTTLSFDIAGLELYLPLIRGAKVVVATREQAADAAALQAFLANAGVTVMQATPATWRLLLDAGWEGTPGLRVLCGGEALLPGLAASLVGRAAEVWNMYGPTETTIWSSAWKVVPGDGPISIGRPIANTQMYVLDGHQNLLPAGVSGELYIGGEGLSPGYWKRPDLTAERFLPDPFSAAPAARLYRTGDLARWLPDGRLECLTRLDRQVKVRGFRIELGEIEAALERHPHVRQAVVVARTHALGDTRLVGFLVAEPTEELDFDELRRTLRTVLPEYMVPSHFKSLDALPLTPNGKVDQRALGSVEPNPSTPARRGGVPPRDLLDAQFGQIWEEILGCGPVGIDDNFFDLGGHSLLAVRMIERVKQAFGRRLPVSALFAGATIRHLVRTLLEESRESFRCPLALVQASTSRPPFFFLHGDYTGGGFYCLELARQLGPEQPFYVFHPRGLDGGPVPSTIEAMADEYLSTLRAFRPTGPYLLGGFCNGGLVAFEMARRLRAQGERVDFLLAIDTRAWSAGFRWLQLPTRWFATARRLSPGDQQQLFLGLRMSILSLERRLKACRHPRDLLRRIYHRVRRDQPHHQQYSGLDAAYGRAVLSYVPRRYPGRLTLFLSAEAARERYDRAWHRMAKECDVHVIPGDHLTSITRHVQIVAEHLRACLDAAQGRDVPGAKP